MGNAVTRSIAAVAGAASAQPVRRSPSTVPPRAGVRGGVAVPGPIGPHSSTRSWSTATTSSAASAGVRSGSTAAGGWKTRTVAALTST